MTARFSVIPARAFDDSGLTHLDIRVLGVIGYHIDRNNEAWPKQETIAQILNVARGSVNRCISRLKERGYLEIVHTSRDDGGNAHARYRVLLDPVTPELHGGGHAECDSPCHSGRLQPKELPIGTPSEDKSSGDSAELFPENPPPSKPKPVAQAKPDEDPYKRLIFTAGLALFKSHGHGDGVARGHLGRLLKLAKDDTAAVANAITAAEKAKPVDLVGWLTKAVRARVPGTQQHAAASRDDSARELDQRFQAFASGERWRTHWGPAPDDPAAEYPAELYRRHGVKPWEASA